jgi:CTP synthase
VLAAFGITDAPQPDLTRWEDVVDPPPQPEGEVTIAIVGKYTGLKDAYKSLIEALTMAASPTRVKVNGLDRERDLRARGPGAVSEKASTASWCPAASASAAARARSRRALRARAQRAVFRHLLRHADGGDRGGAQPGRHQGANSTEFGPTKEPVVGLMTEWTKGNELEKRAQAEATSAAPCASAPIRRS